MDISLFCLCVGLVLVTLGATSSLAMKQDVAAMNCKRYNKTLNVHAGWPYEISAIDYIQSFYRSGGYADRIQINVTNEDTGMVVFSQTSSLYGSHMLAFLIPDIHKDSHYSVYTTLMNKGQCELYDVRLHVTDPSETCEEFSDPNKVKWFEAANGAFTSLPCQSLSEIDHKVVLDKKKHNFTVQWLRNCNSTLPNNTELTLRRNKIFEQINFQQVHTNDVGVYTCAVTYKGKTRFVRSRGLCVGARIIKEQPLIKCSKSAYLVPTLGSNLTINCSIAVGIGVVQNKMIATYWNKSKDNNFECINTIPDKLNTFNGNGSQHTCIRHLYQPNERCFRTPPTPDQLKSEEEYVVATLNLINIQTHDLGVYSVWYEAASGRKIYHNIAVNLDERTVVEDKIIYLGVGIGIAVLLLVFLFLLWIFRFALVFYWTKYCGGGYNAGKKERSLESTFSDQEIQIPLPSRDRLKSSISSDSGFGIHPTGVERFLSTATATTEVGSPDDLGFLP